VERTPILEVDNLNRVFKGADLEIHAVVDASFRMERGEFSCVVGSSGSGKSTLLNLIASLDTPTSGQILFNGQDTGDMSRREKAAYRGANVGMVFQSFNLIGHLTALRNVEMALMFGNSGKADRRTLARDILERLGMSDRVNHKPGDLSGGEQQRVAIARAIVSEPDILLADEPTGNLDKENTESIAKLMKELNSEGLTILMVTHDIELARISSGRIMTMRYGELTDSEDTP